MTKLIGVYGAAGCGRSILPLVRAANPTVNLVFIDDGLAGAVMNGHIVVDWAGFIAKPAEKRAVCLAIANSKIREKLALLCDQEQVPLIGARAANVVVMDEVTIGVGACLSPFVTLTSNIRIGRCFHANLYAYVEHDCEVGNFVTLAPGAKINGNVRLDDHVYIGSGAIIRQGVRIGREAVIGMGAVVTRDVPAGTTVVGNPARPMRMEK